MNGKYKKITDVVCIILFLIIFFGILNHENKNKPRYKYEIVCKTKTIYCNEIDKHQDHYNIYDTNETDEDAVKIDDVTNIKILK